MCQPEPARTLVIMDEARVGDGQAATRRATPHPLVTSDAANRWVRAMSWAVWLGCLALLTNLTTTAQLSGDEPVLLAARFAISKLANAGVVWAGVSVLAGWLVRRPVQAAVAGVAAGEVALLSHYLLGQLMHAPTSVIQGNEIWLLAAALFGAPLGLVGAAMRRPGPLGTLAALVVPLGAIAEPFVRGMFATPAMLPWPDSASSAVSGMLLVAVGLAASVRVLLRARRGQSPRPQ
ncbi:DUF6518 family protein [Propionibacteriaceae bacterium G57]|uniref:DUF6518 family protein n=1 Tax=Aestuariimicrobium sp. G57 TaxID=3418485 RepID=UPI003DA739AC